MSKKKHRNLIIHLNKYQKWIIYPVLVSSLITCIISVLCLLFVYYPEDFVIYKDVKLAQIRYIIPKVMIGISFILIFVIFWTYYMSNKLVGPYKRIVEHIDGILEGKSQPPLGTRKGDEMFEELISRINKIIDKK